jgi:hypothetical protein
VPALLDDPTTEPANPIDPATLPALVFDPTTKPVPGPPSTSVSRTPKSALSSVNSPAMVYDTDSERLPAAIVYVPALEKV